MQSKSGDLNSSEIKSALRKSELRFSARDALLKAEELICSYNSNLNRQQALKQTELTLEIIAEFVFNEVDRRGVRKKLTSTEEVEVILAVIDHLVLAKTEVRRNAVFLSLFPLHHSTDRTWFLVTLISLAISTISVPVLSAAAAHLQQVGCTSTYASHFARKLVQEYFMLVPIDTQAVIDLPKDAPLFVANFLTAVTEGYSFIEGKQKFILPPRHMLEIVVRWIKDNPRLCLTPLLPAYHPALPQGAIVMPAVTPYTGLFKWCIMSVVDTSESSVQLYSLLESLLLSSLERAATEGLAENERNVVLAQDLATSVPALLGLCFDRSAVLNQAIDRLARIIQVTMVTQTLYGSKQELWRQLESLPPNKLMQHIKENIFKT
uniref:Uncharacterized protein n=2 Tax=Triatoma infestans TaxID=30076 RepID=A0A023F8T1_TRIIF